MKPQTWRRLRQIVQILALALFLFFFIYATFLNPQRAWADFFYRLDPLVALTATLAGRALIPGLGLILPMLLLAWFNRQTFAFDSLAVHATAAEWQEIRRTHAVPLFILGLVLALLAHVPFLGLLVPALSALAYIHYCLEALRELRGGALVSVTQHEIREIRE